MALSVVEHIKGLLRSRGISQSDLARDIFVSRQQLSYFLSGTRDLTLDLALRLESYFELKEGSLLAMQAMTRMHRRKAEIRDGLVARLKASAAFWSYQEVEGEDLSDEDVIENTIVHLDMEEIEALFFLYGWEKVKKVWKDRLACQGEHMQDLNVMMAMYFFGIKKPEQYLRRLEYRYFKSLESYAQGTDGEY